MGSDFTDNEEELEESFDEGGASIRSSEKRDSEDSDIDISESEGSFSEEEERKEKRKPN